MHGAKAATRLLLAVVVLTLAAGGVVVALAHHQGDRAFVVRTGSMTPDLPPGDLVIDAPPAEVVRGFTEPEPFAAWFVAEGFSAPSDRVTLDVRPGGLISAVFVGEHAQAIVRPASASRPSRRARRRPTPPCEATTAPCSTVPPMRRPNDRDASDQGVLLREMPGGCAP